MFGLPALDVFIGLSFIFLVLSLIASGLQEVVQAILGLRGKTLRKGLKRLLKDPTIEHLAKKVYEHPLVSARSGWHGPSYLKPTTFSLALMDVLGSLPKVAAALEAAPAPSPGQASVLWGSAETIVTALPDGPVKQQLLLILADAEPGKAKAAIESWFETTMDRVEGWFKRSTLLLSVALGIAIAVAGNVDAVRLARHLASSPGARAALVQQAQTMADRVQAIGPAMPCAEGDDACKAQKAKLDTALDNLNESIVTAESAVSAGMLPVGWQEEPMPVRWQGHIVGWLLTAIAISVGAPFWFSMLQKLMSFRATGAKPGEPEQQQQAAGQQAQPAKT
jgi:hypothetical protein